VRKQKGGEEKEEEMYGRSSRILKTKRQARALSDTRSVFEFSPCTTAGRKGSRKDTMQATQGRDKIVCVCV